ncbi:hypothetical protein A3A21_03485 [Candidatus Jorgensenbacteria bacterium RIFCSPLOWO2_01_FULL_45_25b]|uniref:Phosphoglycerate mutase n=1 Tax=Candidatus Jorgensenbacteria bacterium RIFCSPLOWO2_01_FULL_45_25b TaxID=1798471 RepID=A0A1F6BZ54_9BACT|nr:MAG: hypothetical protein A3A21_03485 [Candidatus Jorgensenbacteria bacterium RIFCSPLOWO2_01_FULL_45_25b]
MKTTKIIFLRHAETQKDPLVNAVLWGLSERGRAQAEEVSKQPIMSTVDMIYVSEEKKTAFTAEPIAKKFSKEVCASGFFNEVGRGDKFFSAEEFEAEKARQLTNLSYRAFGGESGLDALLRFKKGINEIVRKNPEKTILIVTHGTILNIYFADMLNFFEKLPERWSKTAFCAYGIIENGEVRKDIV